MEELKKTKKSTDQMKVAADKLKDISQLGYKVGVMSPEQLEELTKHLSKVQDMMLV